MTGEAADFAPLTEQWGMMMPDIQRRMACVRYSLAAEHARGRDYLEIGCGSGFGLELVGRTARWVVGGDLTESNLRASLEHSPNLDVALFDAHHLPFADGSFDVVAIFEVIYYFADIPHVLEEVRRILRPAGELIVCLPNRERPGFHESPLARSYPSAGELQSLMTSAGFNTETFGGFRMGELGITDRLLVAGSSIARKLHLIPDTLSGRGRIKRLVYGRLHPLGSLEFVDTSSELARIDNTSVPVTGYKNLYAVGGRRGGER